MEDAVRNFLIDIISEIHPPELIGQNRYMISIRHELNANWNLIYVGKKRRVYCEQIGHVLWIYIHDPKCGHYINLADPNSRDIITNIFRTN